MLFLTGWGRVTQPRGLRDSDTPPPSPPPPPLPRTADARRQNNVLSCSIE